jgi:hypothetical protein
MLKLITSKVAHSKREVYVHKEMFSMTTLIPYDFFSIEIVEYENLQQKMVFPLIETSERRKTA